jgi:hypothetical protein
MKRFLLFIACISFVVFADAQIVLKGKVSSEKSAAQFVNVSLFDEKDTTKLVTGTMTDAEGNYVMSNVAPGNYRLAISGITYNSLKQTIMIGLPKSGNVVERNYTLTNNTISLKGVTVTGNRTTNYLNKSVFTFTDKQIKAARYANDLVADMPKVVIDPETNTLKNLNGASMKILINGVSATDNDLKSITPDEVLRVEYYDMPPARYSDVKTLINVITRPLDTGWNGGLDIDHAFTTGFGDDNAYFTYVKGRNQFSFDYSLNLRDYRDKRGVKNYAFVLDNSDWKYHYDTKDSFGYTTNNINFKYTNSLKDSYTFQAIFSPNFDTLFSNGNSNINVAHNDSDELYYGVTHNRVYSFGPSLDLYYSKNLRNNQELTLDVVGTLYHNRQRDNNDETVASTGESVLSDHMTQNNNKQSLIGELAYGKTFTNGSFNAGYKGTIAHSGATIYNFLTGAHSYDYSVHIDCHYFYAEYMSRIHNFMYRLGIGETIDHYKNDEAHYTNYLFNPKAEIAYTINNRNQIRLAVKSEPVEPTLSDLSDNVELITDNIVRKGNPSLKSGNDYEATLTYKITTPYIDAEASGVVDYTHHPINSYYCRENIDGKDYIVSTSENANSMLEYGGITDILFRPFKSDAFKVKLTASAIRYNLDSPIIGSYRHWYTPVDYYLSYRVGCWEVSYEGNIVSKMISGAYLRSDENESHLQLLWKKNNLSLFAKCFWIFSKSKYSGETIPNNILQYDYHTHINDNRSMLTLGLSCTFTKGKNHTVNRSIKNKDYDRGTF